MLVISRRADEEIVFPGIGVTIKILRAQANRARIGIDAPSCIEVLRQEIAGGEEKPEWSHRLRNELNSVGLLSEMYRRQLERGLFDKAHQTYLRMLTLLKQVDAKYAETPAENTSSPDDVGDQCNILVVEDDANERELLAGLLRMDGLKVATAENGAEALNRLSALPLPELVLLDMSMPRIDGRETLQAIRATPELATLGVFVVSGRTPDEAGIAVGEPCGADKWFEKPLNPGALMSAIRERRTSAADLIA